MGSIEDLAAAVIYLASEAACLVPGIVLPVHGGWAAQWPPAIPLSSSSAMRKEVVW